MLEREAEEEGEEAKVEAAGRKFSKVSLLLR